MCVVVEGTPDCIYAPAQQTSQCSSVSIPKLNGRLRISDTALCCMRCWEGFNHISFKMSCFSSLFMHSFLRTPSDFFLIPIWFLVAFYKPFFSLLECLRSSTWMVNFWIFIRRFGEMFAHAFLIDRKLAMRACAVVVSHVLRVNPLCGRVLEAASHAPI